MTSGLVDIGIAERTRSGEVESGDRCVVATNGRRVLLGVIDGVGHGPQAALAAAAAAAILEAFVHEPVDTLLERCHTHLRATRGAAITLAVVDTDAPSLEWVGAGNVVAALQQIEPFGLPATRELLVRAGAAGGSLPSTRVSRLPLARGDTLVIATDGVDPAFTDDITCSETPQQLADRLLKRYATPQDDALVLVARLRATEP
ncbi:MAG TPA: SpoIIE family protein phosphatase [Gammaproteobacteria bacterium]|nr:SpoIIE family protein phosphatase [Gammaproteobacteria bacterium]